MPPWRFDPVWRGGGGVWVGPRGVAVWGGGYDDVDVDIDSDVNVNRNSDVNRNVKSGSKE